MPNTGLLLRRGGKLWVADWIEAATDEERWMRANDDGRGQVRSLAAQPAIGTMKRRASPRGPHPPPADRAPRGERQGNAGPSDPFGRAGGFAP